MKVFAVRAVLIVLIAIGLFFISDFFVAVPSLERIVMQQKRELIRELTNSAWNILAKLENDERNGILTREEAQQQAIQQIQSLHYGIELKDYFWINDLHPRMVIHPYRTDLNGKDLSDFVDPHGKKLFLEVVDVVRRQGAGYVSYSWQWMDDPSRIVPKISYVKGFEPWGWIIGTGVYIDDIQSEIRSARRNVIAVSFGILLISALLLLIFLYESLKIEKQRRRTAEALEVSEERYRLLVESAGESIFMRVGDGSLYANHSLLELLGYPAEEFSILSVADFVMLSEAEKSAGYSYISGLLSGLQVPYRYETSLRDRDGDLHEVTLSLSRITVQNQPGFIAIASEITPRRAREIQQDRILSELQSLVFFLDRPVGEICTRDYHSVPAHLTLIELARDFRNTEIPLLAVQDDAGNITGLVSRECFFRNLSGCNRPETVTVGSLIRSIPAKIPKKSLAFEAFNRMIASNFDPLLVIDEDGSIIGVVTETDLLLLQRYSPALLQKEIENAGFAEELVRSNRRLPELIRILVRTGLRTDHVNQIITQNTRSILNKALDFAFETLGPAPCEFVFMVMGSEGRYEQTLKTDQDNAIVYRDPPPEQRESARKYFLELGTKVCDVLNSVGYTYCEGGIMAKNPQWTLPMSGWIATLTGWLSALEPEDLLNARIFFDFRAGTGSRAIINELRTKLDAIMEESPGFFLHLVRNVLLYEPPISRFGNFVYSEDAGSRKVIDIKSAMTLIVDFARVYALKHHIPATNTRERLLALTQKNILSGGSTQEMLQAYEYLMRLRIENQIRAIEQGRNPDNFIDPESLTQIDQKILKEIFIEISHFQARLSYDFTGTMQHG